jgi:hypothetical protein
MKVKNLSTDNSPSGLNALRNLVLTPVKPSTKKSMMPSERTQKDQPDKRKKQNHKLSPMQEKLSSRPPREHTPDKEDSLTKKENKESEQNSKKNLLHDPKSIEYTFFKILLI